jgi:cytochrome c biogenesis protein CcmG, thiol:disulfide interchange protein DsbE
MKNKIILIVSVFLFIFIFIVFYKGLNNSNIYSPSVNYKKNIPSFKAKKFNFNSEVDSESIFIGKNYYILNIWSSWCVPCIDEHPILMSLSSNKSLKIIGLNYKDNNKNAKNFIEKLGNPFSDIFIDEDGTLAIEWGAYGVPETFLIDKNKKIIKKYIGPLNQQSLNEIKKFLK